VKLCGQGGEVVHFVLVDEVILVPGCMEVVVDLGVDLYRLEVEEELGCFLYQ